MTSDRPLTLEATRRVVEPAAHHGRHPTLRMLSDGGAGVDLRDQSPSAGARFQGGAPTGRLLPPPRVDLEGGTRTGRATAAVLEHTDPLG